MTEKQALIIIAPQDFQDDELSKTVRELEKKNISYTITSTREGLAVGMNGGKILIDKTISDLSHSTEPYAALILIGGSGTPAALWNNKKLHALVTEYYKQQKIVAAICLAPVVLARTGILQGKKATVFFDDTPVAELKKGEAIYVGSPVVVDGTIITANGPSAAPAFGEKIAKALTG
ncbi:MAG: DJ-1/PfpI family protein [Methanomicrobiales archaeon]|jgi:protease I|nr:DJ-1/PfpI family protein [Methanomicrobiales archaeon]